MLIGYTLGDYYVIITLVIFFKMAARHFLKVTDEDINNIVSKKMHINFVHSIFVFQRVSLIYV